MPVRCANCAASNADGAKFCAECGTRLGGVCVSCGTPSSGGRFCSECGSALGFAPTATVAALPAPSAPVAERRVTSVLFGDLVGFTALSESRDAEDVRELLSRYFATARTVVERYGGTVEKFI